MLMNTKKINLFIISLLTALVYLSVVNLSSASAQGEITLDIMPGEVLFDVDNMKPGDWAPRTVVVQNNGLQEFSYATTLQPDKQSMKLFNELLLEVEDAQGELYNGKLADFKQLESRSLKPAKQEEIDFTVRFPTHLGNEFQGLDAKFTLFFSAEGSDNSKDEKAISGTISGDDGGPGASGSSGSELPATATSVFNMILVGALLLAGGGWLIRYNRCKMNT